ncbi:MAG: hypothetical protein QOG91_501 [Candidatus Parcubacteria bacterium]|nr:hypothetical protein [Candidatus Parcubacteria bacterium]
MFKPPRHTYRTKRQGGYIMILNTLFFISILMVVIVGVASVVLSSYGSVYSFVYSKQSYIAAHSAVEEALYRLKSGFPIGSALNVTLSTGSASIIITTTATGKKITVAGNANNYQRNLQVDLAFGTGVSFHFGIQAGRGGFLLQNSSSVTGNVFSDGPIVGSGNYVYGDAIASEATGLIDGIHATGTAYAHTIQNSIVDKDAFYTNRSNTTVAGISYPNSPDQPSQPYPITDTQVNQWETDAAAGGTATCDKGQYVIGADATIGPIKIPCDLVIKGSGINVTVAGPIWATGNISTQVSPHIQMAASLGSQNIAIIADNPANKAGSGIIDLGQNTTFSGSGSVGSFVFMISQNNSSETGGSTDAIVMGQGSSALVGYAIHGQITLAQSVSVKEVTAYKIILTQSSNVTYDTGLPSVLFQAGPGGGYDILDWIET